MDGWRLSGAPPVSHADLGHLAAAAGGGGDLPVIVKGVLTAEDTERAVKYGISGVIVSNHGARQLDQVGGTIEALPECVQAAGGKIPVMIDGGFRRGTDIFKALALGASAVGVGRPYLWGLGAFGQRGVARVIELLRAELGADMGMAGVAKIAQIDRSFVRARPMMRLFVFATLLAATAFADSSAKILRPADQIGTAVGRGGRHRDGARGQTGNSTASRSQPRSHFRMCSMQC